MRAGGEVEQETLHFDPRTEAITSLRSKEEAHDYRYFPEPDLVPIAISEAMLERARAALPELPAARAERFERDLGLTPDSARLLAWRAELGDYFEAALSSDGVEAQPLANWVNELVARIDVRGPGRVEGAARGAGHARRAREREEGHARARPSRCSTGSWPRAATRAAIVEAEGLGAIGGGDDARPRSSRPRSTPTPTPPSSLRAGNMKPIGVDHRPRHARDARARRRRRGHAHRAREARALGGGAASPPTDVGREARIEVACHLDAG